MVTATEFGGIGIFENKLKELGNDLNHPLALQYFWQLAWDMKTLQSNVEHFSRIPPVGLNAKQLANCIRAGYLMIYTPLELMNTKTRSDTGNDIVRQTPNGVLVHTRDLVTQYGWLAVEASLDPPNISTTENDLEEKRRLMEGIYPMRGIDYLIANEHLLLLNDLHINPNNELFDQRLLRSRIRRIDHIDQIVYAAARSRLLGSILGDNSLVLSNSPKGREPIVHTEDPSYKSFALGGRFMHKLHPNSLSF